MEAQTVRVVKIIPSKVWIESDWCGSKHVMRQHEGHEPAQLATVYYCYGHTDNSSTRGMAEMIAKAFGAVEPIEHRHREFLPKATS